jgi:aspartate aminotransferase
MSPERTVVTAGLSKNLALGGWRLGVARLPAGGFGCELRDRLLGIGSEIWSAPAGPVQEAAALAFSEPPEVAGRVALSRRLHGPVAPSGSATSSRRSSARCPRRRRESFTFADFSRWLACRLGGWHHQRPGHSNGLCCTRYGDGSVPGSAFGGRWAAALRWPWPGVYGTA